MVVGSSPIGIIAASGSTPLDIAHNLRGQGYDLIVITIDDITTVNFEDFTTYHHHIGAIGHIIDDLKKAGCEKVVFAGQLKRPALKSIKPDWRGMKIFAQVVASGDDAALKLIKKEFVKDGLEIMSINQIIPELKAKAGIIVGKPVSDDAMESIRLGSDVLHTISPFDIGQGVIVQSQRVLALEGAEGTNEMLKRSGTLIDSDAGEAVFVKMMKVGQDPYLDPPGIGAETIKHAARAKIAVIAVEAGRVVIIDMPAVLAAAERHNITIIGIEARDAMANG